MYFIFYNQILPAETFTRLEERHLDDIEFPVIFKICVTPALNTSVLSAAGYRNIWGYFLGQSRNTKKTQTDLSSNFLSLNKQCLMSRV